MERKIDSIILLNAVSQIIIKTVLFRPQSSTSNNLGLYNISVHVMLSITCELYPPQSDS